MKSPIRPAMVSTGVNVVFTIAIKAPIIANIIATQTHVTVVIQRPKLRNSPFKFSVTIGTARTILKILLFLFLAKLLASLSRNLECDR